MLEPSAQIDSMLKAVALRPSVAEAMGTMMQRASEFDHPLAARLTGIAADPASRQLADDMLDAYWSDQTRQQNLLDSASDSRREVIIGSGVHAATYAAVRVLSGYPRPLVLERGDRVGGTFAMTSRPVFYLNSRNRAGSAGLAGDAGASLNYLPGAPIQASHVSMAEFQTNIDLAFIVRLALAQFADVVTDADVVAATRDGAGVEVEVEDRGQIAAGRLIDARGLGDPRDANLANGTTILTFAQFMARMAGMWPLRGVRRAAVIGGGDSGKCAVEAFLGIGPQPAMAAAVLDQVDRIDWYAENLPDDCEEWQQSIRGRYQAIGRYLRPDRFGVARLAVINRTARPLALPGAGLIDGRSYDLIVLCTGNRETDIDGLSIGDYDQYTTDGGETVARRHYSIPAFRVGPHAQLPFTRREEDDGIADISANAVSIFRTATKTAALAATLPAVAED